MIDGEVISAEIADEWIEADNRRSALSFFQNSTFLAILLVALFLSSTFLYFYLDEEPVDYGASLDYDLAPVLTYLP